MVLDRACELPADNADNVAVRTTAQHFASISISKNHLQNTLSEAIARRDGKQFSELRKPLDKQIQKSTIVLFTKPLPPAEVPFWGSTGQRL